MVVEQFIQNPLMTDCCALAGKAAGRHSRLP